MVKFQVLHYIFKFIPCENNLTDIKKIDVSTWKHNILFKKIVSMQMNTSVLLYFTNLAYWKSVSEG